MCTQFPLYLYGFLTQFSPGLHNTAAFQQYLGRVSIIFCINTHYIYTPGGHGLRCGSVADLLAHRGTCGVWGVVGAR